MIRASLSRALMASAVLAGALTLAGCFGEEGYQLPTRAMKELSPQMVTLLEQKNMPRESPVLVRIFKEESELEIWKQDTTGHFQILKVYPICRWSGDLGPKVHEGDRQAPEGFYTITPDLMQPNSNYYLAINTGFPNAYDRANDRHGAFLMIHGDCSSRGCYAMTDEQIGEIYSLARESFLGGQKSFQIQAYPFRMTPANLARHRTNPNMAFWRMIKEGNDHFEVSHLEPRVEVCNRHYVFDAATPPNSTKPLAFNPTGKCPAYVVAPEIASLAAEKQHNDETQYAALVHANVSVAPITTGLDGGMNRVFLAQVGGGIPPARVPPPSTTLPPQPPPVGMAEAGGAQQSSFGGRMLGGLFGGSSGERTQVAAGEPASQERGGGSSGFFGNLFASKGEAAQHDNAAQEATASTGAQAKKATQTAAKPKPKAEPKPARGEPQEAERKAAPAPQSISGAAPAASGSGTLNGSQPVVPGGSFDSRWAINGQ